MLVKEIGQIITETSKTINHLVMRKVDVSKFKEYFNQLQNFFALVSKNINRPITNHQLSVIKVKLEHSKQDNKKLLKTLKNYLARSEKKHKERMKAKKDGKKRRGTSRTRTKMAKSSDSDQMAKLKRKTPVTVKKNGRTLAPSTSSPYLKKVKDAKLETMKDRYLRKIKAEEEAIDGVQSEVMKIKEQIFDIRTKNTEAIDWHANDVRPIVKAANKKMTMMYMNAKQEALSIFKEFDEWSKLEHFLKRKIGRNN